MYYSGCNCSSFGVGNYRVASRVVVACWCVRLMCIALCLWAELAKNVWDLGFGGGGGGGTVGYGLGPSNRVCMLAVMCSYDCDRSSGSLLGAMAAGLVGPSCFFMPCCRAQIISASHTKHTLHDITAGWMKHQTAQSMLHCLHVACQQEICWCPAAAASLS